MLHARDRGKKIGVDYTLAYGVCYMPTDQDGTGELTDAGKNDRPFKGDSVGTDGRGHGVGHIVGANVPGHIEPEQGRDDKNYNIHSERTM